MAEEGVIMANEQKLLSSPPKDETRLIPDEVLVLILSFLSFKEATATSAVARRWRYLHRWTRKLDFDGTKSLSSLINLIYPLVRISSQEFKQRYKDLRCEYIRWVESVVANYNNSTLEEFRINYDIDISHKDLIDSWIRFAIARKVEKLELNLEPYDRPQHKPYTFPYKNGSEFIFLRKLCTYFVGVSGEVVVSLLRNCPLLEHLSVSYSLDLSSLEIINTFPSFKRLEIYLCYNLTSVMIRDSNLVFLNIFLRFDWDGLGWPKLHQFVVKNVPLLTEIWTTDVSLNLFSTVLPQIEMLKLYISDEEVNEFHSLGVEMSHLKQIVILDAHPTNLYSMLHVINFINSSHGLQRIVLEAREFERESDLSKENIPIQLPIPRKGIVIMQKQRYPCLKEVIMNGYMSRQFELLMHFVETGVALQHIVVDPYLLTPHPHRFRSIWDFIRQSKPSNRTLEMAHSLQSILPSTINLTIL